MTAARTTTGMGKFLAQKRPGISCVTPRGQLPPRCQAGHPKGGLSLGSRTLSSIRLFPLTLRCLFSLLMSLLPCWLREQPDWAALVRAEEATELLALLMAESVCGTDQHGGSCGQSHLQVVNSLFPLKPRL